MEVEEEEQRVAGALGVLAKVTNVRLVQNMLKAVSLADQDETTFCFKGCKYLESFKTIIRAESSIAKRVNIQFQSL